MKLKSSTGIVVLVAVILIVGLVALSSPSVPPTPNVNLGVIPTMWGSGNTNPAYWVAYGSGSQIAFLTTDVERTPGNPSIWFRFPHTSVDMNGARECDGVWYPCKPGDHVIFKCWEKTGLSDNPAYNNDPTGATGAGARIGMDFYHDNGDGTTANLGIGALVNGLGSDTVTIPGYPRLQSAYSAVPCNTPVWTQQVIDFVVPSGYNINQIVGWMQMRPEQGDSVQGWFADAELYIIPA